MNAIKAQSRHVFVEDPALADPTTGTRWCLCGRPFANQIHTMPESPGQAEHRKRVGDQD